MTSLPGCVVGLPTAQRKNDLFFNVTQPGKQRKRLPAATNLVS